jgi:hypothetical protein
VRCGARDLPGQPTIPRNNRLNTLLPRDEAVRPMWSNKNHRALASRRWEISSNATDTSTEADLNEIALVVEAMTGEAHDCGALRPTVSIARTCSQLSARLLQQTAAAAEIHN